MTWIPLSKMCLCGVVATPDKDGTWCWVVDGTQWKYNGRQGLDVLVMHNGTWKAVGNVGTLNHAVAFSLGWRARNQFPASEPMLNLDALEVGVSLPIPKAPA